MARRKKMPRRRLDLSPEERQRIEHEIRKERAEDFKDAFDDVVAAALKYAAELDRSDNLHQARLSKLRSHLKNMIRYAAEALPGQPVTDDDIRKWIERQRILDNMRTRDS